MAAATPKPANIHKLAFRGQTQRVQSMVAVDPSLVNLLDSNQSTPLHHASYRGHIECARILLEKGAEVDAVDKDQCTPLHNASYMGKRDMIAYLIENGANVDHKDIDKSTPLHKASFAGHVDCAKLLVESHCLIDEPDNEGITALQKATYNDHHQTLEFLLEQGANVLACDLKGSSAFHKAAFNGNLPCIKILIEKGVDSNVRDNEGTTPLHNAVYSGHAEVVSALLSAGSEPNAKTTKNHSTCLHFAAFNGYLDCLKQLLDKGSEINAVDVKKMTPLHYAVKREHEDCLQHLIERGANLDALDYKGRGWAQMTQNKKIIQICRGDGVASQRREIRTGLSFRNFGSDLFAKPLPVPISKTASGTSLNLETPPRRSIDRLGSDSGRRMTNPSTPNGNIVSPLQRRPTSPSSSNPMSPASTATNSPGEKDLAVYAKLDRNGFVVSDTGKEDEADSNSKAEVSRAMKWMKLVQNWEAESKRNPKKIRTRCEKGIPARVRILAWPLLAKSSQVTRKMTAYQDLLTEECPDEEQIMKDISRTFPQNILLMEKGGKQALANVLKATSIYNREIGYCQGMAFVCGLLLMYMSEEDSFWMLTQLETEYEMGPMWKNPGDGACRMGFIMRLLLESICPRIYSHIVKVELDLNMVMIDWLLPGWLTDLPFSLTLRIWDIFLLEGMPFMFSVALALFKYFEHEILKIGDGPELLMFLKFDHGSMSGPAGKIDTEVLIKSANSFKDKVKQKYKDMERGYQKAVERGQ